MIVATLVGWVLSESDRAVNGQMQLATAGVIATAFFKVWVVGFEFMELRHAPRWLRHGFDAWVLMVCAMLIALCVFV